MNKYRSHTCNELRKNNVGKSIVISGWINKKRDHGNLLFIDLRDNFGITQCIIDQENKNFKELEKVVSHSKLLISCHGAISHVASAYNIRQIDIIDINSKEPYSNWTDHFRNYSSIYRENFPNLSSKILNNDYFSQI